MKHLANCTNTELMRQFLAMRAPLKSWLERTGIPAIRKRRPEGLDALPDDERAEALRRQAAENTADVIDAALTADFDGTVALLCMATFTPVEEFDAHPLIEYIDALREILRDPGVAAFFTLAL